MSETTDESFRGGPGKVHPKQRRSAALPSDRECHACGGVIEHESQCYRLQRVYNNHGDVETLDCDGPVVCRKCGGGLLDG